jgi:hypothetical protein
MKKHLTRNRLVKKYNLETPPALRNAQDAAMANDKARELEGSLIFSLVLTTRVYYSYMF